MELITSLSVVAIGFFRFHADATAMRIRLNEAAYEGQYIVLPSRSGGFRVVLISPSVTLFNIEIYTA